ncbi:hypothetical protein Ae706Ps2_5101 [Pseudonocardia sp. Ae706_Ps2]|nr:hypothetical protein Ae505Ps2_0213c [Pseudonocardia sp. Ae505_Ps2]OLM26668.1 hypothetical protein Ae706Ps2_5101 [Pseudonocardia sp. Ae706_Ps2]
MTGRGSPRTADDERTSGRCPVFPGAGRGGADRASSVDRTVPRYMS